MTKILNMTVATLSVNLKFLNQFCYVRSIHFGWKGQFGINLPSILVGYDENRLLDLCHAPIIQICHATNSQFLPSCWSLKSFGQFPRLKFHFRPFSIFYILAPLWPQYPQSVSTGHFSIFPSKMIFDSNIKFWAKRNKVREFPKIRLKCKKIPFL